MAPRGHTGHRHVGLVDTEDMVPCLSIRVSSERQASILVTVSSFYKGTKDGAPGLVLPTCHLTWCRVKDISRVLDRNLSLLG